MRIGNGGVGIRKTYFKLGFKEAMFLNPAWFDELEAIVEVSCGDGGETARGKANQRGHQDREECPGGCEQLPKNH